MAPKHSFFTGSDEEQDEDSEMTIPRKNTPESLFLPAVDSDDDQEMPQRIPSPDNLSDIEAIESEPPRESSSQGFVSDVIDISSDSDEEPVDLKPIISQPPRKKRRISPPDEKKPAFHSKYVGSLIVGNAWSIVKGKGYVKNGDQIFIERDDQDEPVKPAAKDGKKKQMSIATMFKARPANNFNSKKKVDTAVRLTNKGGFEFGRLPQEVSIWLSRLLDMGIVEVKNCRMIDCPAIMHSGAELIVSLSIYMLHSAFKPANSPPPSKGPNPKLMYNEGEETTDERSLRERKNALNKLFQTVSLMPVWGVDFRKSDDELHEDALERMQAKADSEKMKKPKKTEIVGDGEEIEVEDGEDLSENELNTIYRKAQRHDKTMGEAEPASGFAFTLRNYQKQALKWMQSMEAGSISARDAQSMHPLWSEYVFPAEPDDNGVLDLSEDEPSFYFNPYSGELSLQFPVSESRSRGGILADEMGMGKTIMISALIVTPSADGDDDIDDETVAGPSKKRQTKLNTAFRVQGKRRKVSKPSATLIVAPTSLLSQWSEELTRSNKPGTVEIFIWHGSNRLDLEEALDGDDDDDNDKAEKTIKIVITSYGVLASEHSKSKTSPVFEIDWLRVVLDEAHHCKSRSSKTAKAVYALQARRRWAVTGTPIVNKLEDLFSLLKFLYFAPWNDFSFFRSFITLPFLARDPKAIEIVQVILESILLRREKNMRDVDGKKIVDLPPKTVKIENLAFTTLERKIYDSLYTHAKRNFTEMEERGLVGKNYTHILAMIMRLRRAVLHPSLVLKKDDGEPGDGSSSVDINAMIERFQTEGGAEGNVFAAGVLANLGKEESAECPLCMDVMQTPMVIPTCMHQCCKECIVAYISSRIEKGEEGQCPICLHGPIKESELMEVVRTKKEEGEDSDDDVTLRKNDFQSSTKLDALLQNLGRLQDQDPKFKAVVFSQFTSFLDLIQQALQRDSRKYTVYRFDGSMNVAKRSAAVSEFKEASTGPKILIVSLKAGGVGLNLTAANHVFMMDCWWNAATESQAIDRVHRIGQTKEVFVTHFIVERTIEDRILQIQKRKTAIVKEAFRTKGATGDKADPDSIQNLRIMFGDD